MPDDDVQLTDLEVIQRYSLAVRGASASRQDLVEVLRADLEWLTGGRRPAEAAPARKAQSKPAKAAPKTASKVAAKRTAKA